MIFKVYNFFINNIKMRVEFKLIKVTIHDCKREKLLMILK